jgi:hypothetical protein
MVDRGGGGLYSVCMRWSLKSLINQTSASVFSRGFGMQFYGFLVGERFSLFPGFCVTLWLWIFNVRFCVIISLNNIIKNTL